MRTALCLGGGATLHKDIERCPISWDGVVACNDAGEVFPGELDAWCSLHPKKFHGWIAQRKKNGHPDCTRFYAHTAPVDQPFIQKTAYILPGMNGSGSSGLMAVKIALIDLGYDRAIMCGVPMMPISHFFDEHAWKSSDHFRKHWRTITPEYRDRIRAMSGWSRLFFKGPEDWL